MVKMSLDEYLWRTKTTRLHLADLLGVSRGAVQGWLRFERDRTRSAGSFPPCESMQADIERETSGAVTVEHWQGWR